LLKQMRTRFVFTIIVLMFMILMVGLMFTLGAAVLYQRQNIVETMQYELKITSLSSAKDSNVTVVPDSEEAGYDDYYTDNMILVVLTDNDGSVLRYGSSQPVYIQEDILNYGVQFAIQSEQKTGIVLNYGMRFLIQPQASGGYKIALADRTEETSGLKFVVSLYLFLSLLAFLVMLVLGRIMARRITQPVADSIVKQRQFTADASHELKTPLTVILADLDILAANPTSTVQEQKKWIDSAKAEADNLSRMVNDLLFLARSDTNEEEAPVRYPFDFSTLVDDCVLTGEALAYETHVELSADLEEHLICLGDEFRIKRLVMILLENAFKYVNEGGSIHVELKRRNRYAYLAVTNTGEPIPETKKPHVFERFFRADESRSQSGYGLGLSIAQNIVKTNNGEISLEYSNESGTRFGVKLPLEEDS